MITFLVMLNPLKTIKNLEKDHKVVKKSNEFIDYKNIWLNFMRKSLI